MTDPDVEAVVVIARWQTTEAAVDEVVRQLTELRALTLTEAGCRGYEALQAADEPTSFTIIERYRDAAAQQEHLDSPHYRRLVGDGIRPLLVDRRVEILRVREL